MSFGDTILLKPAGVNLWAGEADPDFAHMGGRFGGWTAAVLLKAAMLEQDQQGEPLSLSVLYPDAIGDGPIEVSTRLLRSGARLQFWRSEVSQRGKLCAHAQVTFGVRRKTVAYTDAVRPEPPPPESLPRPEGAPPVPFLRQLESRWATPGPLDPAVDPEAPTRSLVWGRSAHGHAMDYLWLAALADYAPPRVAWKLKTFVPSSTVAMTVHFHATPDEIAEVGTDFTLSEVECRRCEGGYFDHELKIWSRRGALLATSEQVAAFPG